MIASGAKLKSWRYLPSILPLVVTLSVQVACGGVEEDIPVTEEPISTEEVGGQAPVEVPEDHSSIDEGRTVYASALSCPSGYSSGCDLVPGDSSTEWMTLTEYGGCCGIGNVWKWYNTKTCRRYCGFDAQNRRIQWWAEYSTGGYCSIELGCG